MMYLITYILYDIRSKKLYCITMHHRHNWKFKHSPDKCQGSSFTTICDCLPFMLQWKRSILFGKETSSDRLHERWRKRTQKYQKCDQDQTKPKDKESWQSSFKETIKKHPKNYLERISHFWHLTNIVGQNEKSESGHPTPFYVQLQSEMPSCHYLRWRWSAPWSLHWDQPLSTKSSQNILKPSNDTPILQT